jgi:hypothetical protein
VIVFRFLSHVVEFGNGLKAYFDDEAKAMDAAVKLHGTTEPVYKRVEIPDPPENACDSPLL